jgi:hypothetical protein
VPVARVDCADRPAAVGTVMAYDVTIERTRECPTAVVRANTTWREFPTLWPTLLGEVWAFLGATPGLRTDGHNVMLYRSGVPGVEVAVEVGARLLVDHRWRAFDPSKFPLRRVLKCAAAAGPSLG